MAGFRFILAGLMLYTILRLRGVPAPSLRQGAGAADGGAVALGRQRPGDVGATDGAVGPGRPDRGDDAVVDGDPQLALLPRRSARLRVWLGLAVGFAARRC